MQGIRRLFGGEYSGTGCYIVVTAGQEDSRGLGNPMTEPFPRRPRVLGSPRSVALAKEGVPPEWEPGCGAPRRRRPVGRERQPGATGHVTSGPGHRTRRGGASRVTGWALAAGSPKARVVSLPTPCGRSARPRWGTGRGARRRLPRGKSAPGSVTGQSGWKSGSRACAGAPTSETAKKAAAIRLPCVRRRVPPVTWEPLTSPRPRACAGASSGAAPSAHQPERLPRAVRVRLDAHRPVVVGPVPAYAESDSSDPPHA